MDDLLGRQSGQSNEEFTFNYFAIKCLSKNTDMVAEGDRNIGYLKAIRWSFRTPIGDCSNGLVKRMFEDHDARLH